MSVLFTCMNCCLPVWLVVYLTRVTCCLPEWLVVYLSDLLFTWVTCNLPDSCDLLSTWVTCCLPEWLVVYLSDLLFTWLVWLILRRNQNHLMRSLLASLMPYISEARVQNLVVAVLAALPDQLAPFLNTLAPSLAPRPTSAWMNAVNLLTQVYSNNCY